MIYNFPIVDSVLKLEEGIVGLQMTISNKHECAVTTLQNILTAVGVEESSMKIVFVLPGESVQSFKFPTNLGAVKLYITVPFPSTEDVMKNFMVKRKSPG